MNENTIQKNTVQYCAFIGSSETVGI